MVKTVSELESHVKSYRGNTKKQKEGDLHACIRLEGDGGGHVAGWLSEGDGGGPCGWLDRWLAG
jgi:hypothetical protein